MNQADLAPLRIDDFTVFYNALYGYDPFQWQQRLAEMVCQGGWPEYIKLPTASGKTAAVDIAVFAMAYQAATANRVDGKRTAPRRIFFVVDRRIIVNEAYRRTKRAAKFLRKSVEPGTDLKAEDAVRFERLNPKQVDTLTSVANWLRVLAADEHAPPLDCFELRGGIYRNDAWVRSPLQPTVLTSTVDQVGSRLLFRGYGVSDRNLPIHAALTANDSLIMLDEAHCSKPFSQTMKSIERYRGERWAEQAVASPFQFVQMTATPPSGLDDRRLTELTDHDYEVDEKLAQRHQCSKPVRLVALAGARTGTGNAKIAKKLAMEAHALSNDHGLKKIAIVANRVDIARQTCAELEKKHRGRVHLMIGRMRPIDRDDLTRHLQREFGSRVSSGSESAEAEAEPQFIVATQCIEVGADLDFDGMVSQCASLDALRQRFGRLNRLGNRSSARGTIVTGEGDAPPLDKLDSDKTIDPVYGNALARTWHWLAKVAKSATADASDEAVEEVDFGIEALDRLCLEHEREMGELAAPSPNAPVLMPAHIDMFCQTSPRPTPEPNVADYLHGPNHGQQEVRVCWRADLDVTGENGGSRSWQDAIERCPPSSAECLSIPLTLFRKWLRNDKKLTDESSDVLSEEIVDEQPNPQRTSRNAFVWRGKAKRSKDGKIISRSFVVDAQRVGDVIPSDTIVIPAEFGGWSLFGHIPEAPSDPSEPATKETLLPSPRLRGEGPGVRGSSGESNDAEVVNQLAPIDVAEPAFLQSRARTIWRIHPRLNPTTETKPLWDALLAESKELNKNLAASNWQPKAKAIADSIASKTGDSGAVAQIARLAESKGKIVSYPGGVVWTTERHIDLTNSILPLPTFGDDEDTLSFQGRVTLLQHLADVHQEAHRLLEGLEFPEQLNNSILQSAKLHDLGKADPRFQATLLGKPLSIAFMQQQLWAKSESYSPFANSELPAGFRHEMLSLALLEHLDFDLGDADAELAKHETASHHGYARPFAPYCADQEPPGVNLASLNGPAISAQDRKQWGEHWQAHRLDSGIADRFWTLTRRYGWWGLALLESVLRLADWSASANPGQAAELSLEFLDLPIQRRVLPRAERECRPLVLTGLDGSNPLAFLAALGVFRIVSSAASSGGYRLSWSNTQGAWRPALSSVDADNLTEESLLEFLAEHLATVASDHAASCLADRLERESMREVFADIAARSTVYDRMDADWLSCNGSDIAGSENISQLQTTRRDYHSINMRGLICDTTRNHLARSLFEAWDYADPIAGVSLHLEPREDRRHAYQWHMPSGDPTRKVHGGMMGANRLALEAWPLFQSLPKGEKLITTGFSGTRANDTQFSWPIWSTPVTLATLQSVLSLGELQRSDSGDRLDAVGIEAVFRCSRILVGKTPNLTLPIAV